MDDFSSLVQQMAESMEAEPVTVTDFGDVCSALDLIKQYDLSDLLNARLADLMRTLGRLAPRYESLDLGEPDGGIWDALCRQRQSLADRHGDDPDVREFVRQHAELSRLCAQVRANARNGARALLDLAHQWVPDPATTKH